MTAAITAYLGVIGAGKDHRSNLLVEAGTHGRVDFKDGLLDLASDICGFNVRENYDHFKSAVIGVRPASNPLSQGFQNSEWKDLKRRFPELLTGRHLLQRLGTEGMRKRDEEYWVKLFIKEALRILTTGKGVVNADCRFFNEIAAIKGLGEKVVGGCQFVFCNYKSSRYSATGEHASEKLAQTLLGLGLKDGEIITDEHFQVAAEKMGEVFNCGGKEIK